jgi:GTP-binding protein YchF
MKLGIIDLPQSGKTTIYNALTRSQQPTILSGKIEVHTAVVDVPDPRVDRLSEMYNPKKTTYAKVTYADIAGLDGSGQGEIFGQLRNELGNMDGFIHIVRVFQDDSVLHISGSLDPARDIAQLDAELLLIDLIAVEGKLERLEEERGKGGRDKAEVERELALFRRLQLTLSEEQPLRTLTLTPEDEKRISGYQFLTRKPMLVILNLSEGQAVPELFTDHHSLSLQGQLEMEIAQLPGDDAALFLQKYGIEEPDLNRVIRASYQMIGLQSFFTVGEDEVRAWTVRGGSKAPEAAGVVHSDLQKGFIRAEIIPVEDLLSLGGLPEAREQGKLRVEGKEYVVYDGDIMHVRFNV